MLNLTLFLLTRFSWLQPVLAQFAPPPGTGTPAPRSEAEEIVPNASDVLGDMLGTKTQGGFFSKLGEAVVIMTGYLLGLMGFLAVLALIYAGFLWVTSAANPDNIKKAKAIITYAVIGLLLAAFSYAIVRTFTRFGTWHFG